MKIDFLRKSKLFHREEIKPLNARDYVKVAAIIGIIVVPLLMGLAV
ncbi:MAG: hypothetical protein K5790_01040 [Nitrosopumilus sp.]|nr:hypothetical protein [Nitrosopumilus sp.]MCV0391859.1 hypothetical protein [Nitrosopumilus sp.]